MNKDSELKIIISAQEKASTALEKIRGAAGKLPPALKEIRTAGEKAFDLSGPVGKARAGVESISSQLATLKAQFIGVFAAQKLWSGFTGLVQMAETVRSLDARLKMATRSGNDFIGVQSRLYAISASTGSAYGNLASLYARVERSTRGMSLSQEQNLGIVRGVAQALRVSDASAQEVASTTLQFSQSLASGVMRGEEFNSIMEASPRLMQAVADGLKVPIGSLRSLAEQGLLTTGRIVPALLSQLGRLESEGARLPRRTDQAWTSVSDQFGKAVAHINEATGATQLMAGSLDLLANSMGSIVSVGLTATVGALTAAVVRGTGAVRERISAYAQEAALARQAAAAELSAARNAYANAQAAMACASMERQRQINADQRLPALLRLTAAEKAYAATLNRQTLAGRALTGALNLVGGPIGLITTALTMGLTAWSLWGDAAAEAGDRAAAAAKKARSSLEEAQAVLERLRNADAYGTDELAAARKALTDAKTALAAEQQTGGDYLFEDDFSDEAARQKRLASLRASITEAERILSETEALIRRTEKGGGDNTSDILVEGVEKFVQGFRNKLDPLNAALNELRTRAKAAGVSLDSGLFQEWEAVIRRSFVEKAQSAFDDGLTLLRDSLARQKTALENSLSDRLVSIRSYYAEKTRLEQADIDAQISAVRQQLAADGGNRKLEETKKLEAELIVLNRRRGDVATANARAAAAAEKELATALADVKTELAGLTGTATADDQTAAIRRQYADLRQRLAAEGDTEGTGLVDRLIDVKTASAKLAELEKLFAQSTQRLQLAQERITTQADAGLITESESRRRIVALQQQSAAELDRIVPAMERAAAAIGPDAVLRVEALKNQLGELRTVTDDVAASVNTGLKDSLSGTLTEIVTGASSAEDALLDLGNSVLQLFAQIASQKLVEQLFADLDGAQIGTWFSGLMGGLAGAAPSAEAAATGEAATGGEGESTLLSGATSLLSGALSLITGGATLTTGGTTLTTAGTLLSSAATALQTAAFALQSVAATQAGSSAIGSGVGAVGSAVGGAAAAAGGGYISGPGTATSDSIRAWLSNGEYVIRAAAVRRYGRAFFDGLNGLRSRVSGASLHFAEGGPVPDIAVSGGGATLHNAVKLIVVDDPKRITDTAFSSHAGEEAFVAMLGRNPAKYRSILKI